MNYSGRQGIREIVLIDELVITAIGAQTERCFPVKWSLRPRFQCFVEETAGAGTIAINLEHLLIQGADWSLLGQILVSGDGTFNLYHEALLTSCPFARLRANVVELTGITSAKITLVGTGDSE